MLGSKPKGYQAGHGERQEKAKQQKTGFKKTECRCNTEGRRREKTAPIHDCLPYLMAEMSTLH